MKKLQLITERAFLKLSETSSDEKYLVPRYISANHHIPNLTYFCFFFLSFRQKFLMLKNV